MIEEKNLLLRSVGGSGAEQLPALMQQWEKFELMLDSHQLMIKEQVRLLFRCSGTQESVALISPATTR